MVMFVNYKIVDNRNKEIEIQKVIKATDDIVKILDIEFVKFIHSSKKISQNQKKEYIEKFEKAKDEIKLKLFESILNNLGKNKRYYSSLALISKNIGSKDDIFGYTFSNSLAIVNSKIFKRFSKVCNIQIYGNIIDNSHSIFINKKDGIHQVKSEEYILEKGKNMEKRILDDEKILKVSEKLIKKFGKELISLNLDKTNEWPEEFYNNYDVNENITEKEKDEMFAVIRKINNNYDILEERFAYFLKKIINKYQDFDSQENKVQCSGALSYIYTNVFNSFKDFAKCHNFMEFASYYDENYNTLDIEKLIDSCTHSENKENSDDKNL